MANTRKANVWVVDTTGTLSQTMVTTQIKSVNANGSAQTVTVKEGGSSGTVIYTASIAANSEVIEDVHMRLKDPYVTVGTDTTAYIYVE